METYFAAKARLFDSLLPESGTAVINADSDRAQALLAICARRGIRCWTYGAKGREFRLLKDQPTLGRPAPGGRDPGRAARHRAAAGRRLPGLQRAGRAGACRGDRRRCRPFGRGPGQRRPARPAACSSSPAIAPAPTSMSTTPTSPRRWRPCSRPCGPSRSGRLVVVFGCGGDRDRGKRPVMGEIATRLADLTLVTDDNPRSEEPEAIRAEIVRGIPADRRNGSRCATAARRHRARHGLAQEQGRPAADRRQGPRDRPDHQGRDASFRRCRGRRASSPRRCRERALDLRRSGARRSARPSPRRSRRMASPSTAAPSARATCSSP